MNEFHPNPFAERAALTREAAAAPQLAELQNPYAAPPPADEAASAERGCWRCDDCLLIHQETRAPPVCIRCGCDTNGLFGQDACELRMCEACQAEQKQFRLRCELYGGCALLLICFGFGSLLFRGGLGLNWVGAGLFVGSVLCGVRMAELSYRWNRRRVRFQQQRRGAYFLISGLSPAFLKRLPAAPGSLV